MKTPHKSSGNSKKLYKSNPVNFQIGLVISLFMVYLALQVALPAITHQPPVTASLEEEDMTYVTELPPIKKQAPKIEKEIKKRAPLVLTTIITDPVPTAPDNDLSTEEPSIDLDPDDIIYIEPDPGPIEVPFETVEFVPVFPGCITFATNEERKICMSEKIGQLIQKHFKTRLAERYGLSGIQKIRTQFKINAKGEVTDIKVRSPYPFLEEEAKRVLGLIPQMQPGKQRNIAVEVVFTKSIIFKID